MPFSIHQFSRGINLKNEGGKWVSGGFGAEIANESSPVPEQIKQAVNTKTKGGLRMFGIQEAYPPQPDTIALIARDLGNYCVLAVANRLKDDTGTRELVGYRYFWLDKKQFQNHLTPQNVDGIGTLLYYWQEKKQPQYNIEKLQNNPSSYTTSWANLQQVYLFQHWQPQQFPMIQSRLSDIRPSQQPLIYEATQIGGELTWQEVHCLAIKYGEVNQRYVSWAWNVRKLENSQGLNVIYCADAEAFQLFNRQFPPVTAPTPAATQTPTSLLQDGLTEQNIYPNKKLNTLVTQCLQQFGFQFTKNDVLNLLNFYQQYQEQIWDCRTTVYLTTFSTDPKPHHIKYATLLTALVPNKTEDILNQLIGLNQRDKQVAIQFLVDLKQTARHDKLCYQHSYFIDFYYHLSRLQDALSESSEPNSYSFPPNLNRLRDQIRRFLSPILIILLLGGTVGLMYWQWPNIFSRLPGVSHGDTTNTNGTGGTGDGTLASSGGSGFLGELLDKYDRQHQMFQLAEQNRPEIEKNQTLEEIKTGLEDYRKKISDELKKKQSFLTSLEKGKPDDLVTQARSEQIYKDLAQLLPAIDPQKLPDLKRETGEVSDGSTPDEVAIIMLQKSLERRGHYDENFAGKTNYNPGVFDENTELAVKNAQKAFNKNKTELTKIPEDGIVGTQTWDVVLSRIKDIQVEAVYQTLQTHLEQDNTNIVTEIKNCRDKHKEETPLHFNDCLENIGQNQTTPAPSTTPSDSRKD